MVTNSVAELERVEHLQLRETDVDPVEIRREITQAEERDETDRNLAIEIAVVGAARVEHGTALINIRHDCHSRKVVRKKVDVVRQRSLALRLQMSVYHAKNVAYTLQNTVWENTGTSP